MKAQNNMAAIRNVGIIAHIDAGKTTLSERILFYTQKIHRMGEVHDGTATMDYMPEEQERGITIASACTTCLWGEHTINIIDTPGHVDFTIEVERSLRVLDGAVGVFCAVGGVEPQSETVWRQSENFAVPKIAFINKIDRTGADFEAVLSQLHQRLHAHPLVLNIPAGQGEECSGLLDLIGMNKLTFLPDDQGRTIIPQAMSADEAALAAQWRQRLLEDLADLDDAFMVAYLDDTYSNSDLYAALRRVTLARRATPVLYGAALKNVGIQPVLDAICALLPSPADASCPLAHNLDGTELLLEAKADAPLAALVFKVLLEHGQKISFLRLYAGRIQTGSTIYNANTGSADRVGNMYRLHADRREAITSAAAGDIVALTGLRSAHTGETYTDDKKALLLEPMTQYEPVITLALEPSNADEGKTLDEALNRYSQEDPTLVVRLDEESGMRMLSGMGELHLAVLLERMQREYGISPRAGNPQVVLRETITCEASAENKVDRELGKEHHIGHVGLLLRPRPRGSGNSVSVGDFLPADKHQAAQIMPAAVVDAVVHSVTDGLQSGTLTGYPVHDVAVTITHIGYNKNESTLTGCCIAASLALREALQAGKPLALEPIMRLEISLPEAQLGAAINLVSTRGGKVTTISDHAGQKIVQGTAPLRQLFGFATALRSATQGRAGVVMVFDRFDVA